MTTEDIKNEFLQQMDCSQVVAGAFADALGMDRRTLRKMSACFGGGMHCGETCGAVTGALMVIGLNYGHSDNGDATQKDIMRQKVTEFKEKFAEKYDSCLCRDLLGHDVAQPGELERVLEKGLLLSFCPIVVKDVLDILDSMIKPKEDGEEKFD